MGGETDLDMDNRDPNSLNSHVKVEHPEVLGEPDGAHSIDCLWKNSFKCYNFGLNCCYKFLTTLCGLCLGLYWGCAFACLTFDHVWCLTPGLRYFSILAGTCQKLIGIHIQCCVAPCCETLGLWFSKITVENIGGGGGGQKSSQQTRY